MLVFPTATQLKAIAGGHGAPSILAKVSELLPFLAPRYGIETACDLGCFLGQVAIESDHFKTTVEYASGHAYDIAVNPEKAKSLGNMKPGDGPLYKGAGLIQTTGYNNQRAAAINLGILPQWLRDPGILAQFPYALESALFFWQSNNLSAIANRYTGTPESLRNVVFAITGKVNGKARLALKERTDCTFRAQTFTSGPRSAISATIDGNTAAIVPAPMPTLEPGGAIAAPVPLPPARPADLDAPEAVANVEAPTPDGLSIGDSGPEVRQLQADLVKLGYFVGDSEDGVFGPALRAGVLAYQADHALKSTGVYDAATDDALSAAIAAGQGKQVSEERANATADDLRAKGSTTIAKADQVSITGKAAIAVSTLSGIASAVKSGTDSVNQVKDATDAVTGVAGWVFSHWYVFAGVAVGYAVLQLAQAIIARRVDNHRTGANMSR